MSDPAGRPAREWSVAISLLAADEPYGRALAAEISKHVRDDIFLYSRQQEKIAKDGQLVELFTRVFARDARVVVVLYRKGWGETTYTALEQDALRLRRLQEGARGIIIVSMDGGFPSTWYPADHFRPSAEEFTPAQIASVVTGRVQEEGGLVGTEPPVEKASRLASERAHQAKLDEVLQAAGPKAMEREAHALFMHLKELASQINEGGDEQMTCDQRQRKCCVNYRWGSLVCEWRKPVRNSLDQSELTFSIKDIPTHLSGGHQIREPKLLMCGTLDIALPEEESWAWRFTSLRPRRSVRSPIMTSELGDWLIGELLEVTKGERPTRRRKRRVVHPGWLDDWR